MFAVNGRCTCTHVPITFACAWLNRRQYVPELLPKFVGLFSEAERAGSWDLVRPALGALEALGGAVDDSLHLLLPALMRLISPAASSTPLEIKRAALRCGLGMRLCSEGCNRGGGEAHSTSNLLMCCMQRKIT